MERLIPQGLRAGVWKELPGWNEGDGEPSRPMEILIGPVIFRQQKQRMWKNKYAVLQDATIKVYKNRKEQQKAGAMPELVVDLVVSTIKYNVQKSRFDVKCGEALQYYFKMHKKKHFLLFIEKMRLQRAYRQYVNLKATARPSPASPVRSPKSVTDKSLGVENKKRKLDSNNNVGKGVASLLPTPSLPYPVHQDESHQTNTRKQVVPPPASSLPIPVLSLPYPVPHDESKSVESDQTSCGESTSIESTTSESTSTTDSTTCKSTSTTESTTSDSTSATESTISESTSTTESTASESASATESTTSESTSNTESTASESASATESTTSESTSTTELTTTSISTTAERDGDASEGTSTAESQQTEKNTCRNPFLEKVFGHSVGDNVVDMDASDSHDTDSSLDDPSQASICKPQAVLLLPYPSAPTASPVVPAPVKGTPVAVPSPGKSRPVGAPSPTKARPVEVTPPSKGTPVVAPTPLTGTPKPLSKRVKTTTPGSAAVVPTKRLYRTAFPAKMQPTKGITFSQIMKGVSSLHVSFFEPLTVLQCMCEELEHRHLLEKAVCEKDAAKRMSLVLAFALSFYSNTKDRSRKPFNAKLGETFDMDRWDEQGWRFHAEQVTRNPDIAAGHAEGASGWVWWQSVNLQVKPKLEGWTTPVFLAEPKGSTGLELRQLKETYCWNKASSQIENLLSEEKKVVHFGQMTVQCSNGYSVIVTIDKNVNGKYTGIVKDPKGVSISHVKGSWFGNCEVTSAPTAATSTVFKPVPRAAAAKEYYNLPEFAMQLNILHPSEQTQLPPTDSRLRKDVRLLEEGKIEEADAMKRKLEEENRLRRERGEDARPIWFSRHKEGHDSWVTKGNYWKAKHTNFTAIKFTKLF